MAKTNLDAKLSSCNRKIASNKSKHLLVKNELEKLKTFYSIYFRGKSHFEEDGTQNYLVVQPMYRYFKVIAGVGNGNYIYYWKSKGLSDEKINYIKTSDCGIAPYLRCYNINKIRVGFDGSCLNKDQSILPFKGIVNIHIVYEIANTFNISVFPAPENCLFGAVKLNKNADIDKYRYSGYRIGFNRYETFSFPDTGLGRNVMIFGVGMSS